MLFLVVQGEGAGPEDELDEVDEVDDFLKTPVIISPTKTKKRKAASKSPESPQVIGDTNTAEPSKKRKRSRLVNSVQVLEFSSPATASKKPKDRKSPDLAQVLDSATWTCHKCDIANHESKQRCSGCTCWRGGKRS